MQALDGAQVQIRCYEQNGLIEVSEQFFNDSQTLQFFLLGNKYNLMKTMHQKYHVKALTSLIPVGPSSFSMTLAAMLDHVTDHVDCGLLLFVPHCFCFVFENNMVEQD